MRPSPGPESTAATLRTFTVDKPVQQSMPEPADLIRAAHGLATAAPPVGERLHVAIGAGYVEHADWGAEAVVSGRVGPFAVQAESLFTFGAQGLLFDHGTVVLRHPDQGWLAEAGDLFSDLRGPATGLRVSRQMTNWWRPALAVYGPARHSTVRNTVLAYRDRIEFGSMTIDGEVATDASYFLRGRVVAGRRFTLESSYRRAKLSVPVRDAGAQAEVRIFKGLAVTAGLFQSDAGGVRSSWQTMGVRVPVHRSIGLTFERTFTITGPMSSSASAIMIDAHTSQLLALQRYEWGDSRARGVGALAMQRDQLHSMASYTMGPRLNLGLRVATAWQPSGPSTSWLEAQATMRLTPRTTLQISAPVLQTLDTDRVRVLLEQGLPHHFAVLAEYGRPSAYQDIADGAEPPRFRVMLRRSFDVATPASGGTVQGLVMDYVGRPVPGARVQLGPYSTDTDGAGRYGFQHVPTGDFEISLDPDLLPADYAWDGRSRRVAVKPSSRIVNDLVVAPLNAIHGRVYADRNGNGRFDRDEGVLGAVVRLDGHLTATDSDGAYDFFNVLPGTHMVELVGEKLPAGVEAGPRTQLTIDLRDDRPATGVDFVVTSKVKPVIWRTIK